MIAFAVELPQLRAEVGAHVAHDVFSQRRRISSVNGPRRSMGGEDQAGVEGVDDRAAPADIGVRLPAW